MAQRRMFSPDIVCSDAFLEMPASTRELYFQLGMKADDDGFVNPRMTMRVAGATDDDLKLLVAKRFVVPFENGVIVIKHWRMNNLIRKDWYRPTQYLEQKEQLYLKENGAYTLDSSQGIPLVNGSLTTRTRRIDKDRIEKGTSAIAESSLPILIVKDEPQKEKRKPLDKQAMALREWCYGKIEEEYGARPSTNTGDYHRLLVALKHLPEKDVKYMLEDALSRGKGRTVRSVYTDREIDLFRQENL